MLHFDLSEAIPFEQYHKFCGDEGKPIYFGTPFLGLSDLTRSHVVLNHKILIDSNIMSDIRKGKNKENIAFLMRQGGIRHAELSHIFSSAELYINHRHPSFALSEYYKAINQNYGASIDKELQKEFEIIITNTIPGIRRNIRFIRDWLVIAKYIYNRKLGLQKKAKELSELIKYNHLPILSFMHMMVLLFSYVKENKSDFDEETYNKIKSDMDYRPTIKKEIESLNNVARDISLFMAATEIFYCFEDNVNDFSWIASSDATVGLILQEICFAKISSLETMSVRGVKYTQNHPSVGFRPSGKSFDTLNELISKHAPIEEQNNLIRSESLCIKKGRLPIFSKNLLRMKYAKK